MSYSIRAFCTATQKPAIRELVDHVNGTGIRIQTADVPADRQNDRTWTRFPFTYGEEKNQVEVVAEPVAGENGPAAAAIRKQLWALGSPGLSLRRRRILRHLKNTRFLITVHIPSDIDDDGYYAVEQMLGYLVKNFQGLVQVEGEGFYRGNKLMVKTGG